MIPHYSCITLESSIVAPKFVPQKAHAYGRAEAFSPEALNHVIDVPFLHFHGWFFLLSSSFLLL